MVALTAAIGALLAGAGSVAGAFRSTAQPQQRFDIQERAQQDAENNAAFQRALSVLINQRSVAGTQDSFGSTLRYDPATNTWVSNLGPLPQAEQTAASQAAISRNTTDLGQTQLANTEAMRRAATAGPVYDTAIRNLQAFRPKTADELSGLLTQQGLTANNAVMRPIIADTLNTYARTGTAAAPALAKLGRQSYDNLKDAMVSGRIQALQSTDQLNNTRRQGLESAATTAAGLANPSLQFSGVQSSSQSKDLASLLADRAKTASTAPAFGAAGVNTATNLNQEALKNLAGSVPDPNTGLNNVLNAVKGLGSTLQNKDLLANLTTLFGPKPAADPEDTFFPKPVGFGVGNPDETF